MCMVEQEDEGHGAVAPVRESGPASQMCCKCKKEKAKVRVRGLDSYCRACFLNVVPLVFRRSVYNVRTIIGIEENLYPLLALSGGCSSTLMVHFVGTIEAAKSSQAPRKIFAGVCHIDESALWEGADALTRAQQADEICALAAQYNFPVYRVFIEDIYLNENEVIPSGIESAAQESGRTRRAEQLRQVMFSAGSLTAREDFLRVFRENLLRRVAAQKHFKHVWLGDNGTMLAARVLENVSKGRGFTLPLDTNLIGPAINGISIVRPARVMTGKEIAVYCQYIGLPWISVREFSTLCHSGGGQSSIARLTEKFVASLLQDFQSTGTTIMRTAEKLKFDQQISDHGLRCACCESPLTQKEMDKALASLSTSCDSASSGCGDNHCGTEGLCSSSKRTNSRQEDMAQNLLLCHACHVMLGDAKEPLALPSYVATSTQKQLSRQSMRDEIKEFLLDDNE